jgi:restriction endonuclease S subunit
LPHPKNGYADKPDAKWSATTILRILSDETYTGTLIQGRQGTLNYKIKDIIDKPETEWKRTENAHEAIISKRDFDLAQKIRRLDTRTSPNSSNVYMSPLFVGYATQCSYGVKMPRLGTQDGKNALVPIPPLIEQRRIVAQIDAVLPVCDRL